jgi:flagellar hook-length control protein FliK
MIKRLQFDEAEASSYALSAARESGQVTDEKEQESLALEFKNLLAQISGQLAAIPDGAMAIGLALAQTASVERVKHVEYEKCEMQESETLDSAIQQDSRGTDSGIYDDSQQVAPQIVKDQGKPDFSGNSRGKEAGAEQVVQQVVETAKVVEEASLVVEQASDALAGVEQATANPANYTLDLANQQLVEQGEAEAVKVLHELQVEPQAVSEQAPVVADPTQKVLVEQVRVTEVALHQNELQIAVKPQGQNKEGIEEELVAEQSLDVATAVVDRDLEQTEIAKKIAHNQPQRLAAEEEASNAHSGDSAQLQVDSDWRRNAQNEAFNQRKQEQDVLADFQNQKRPEASQKGSIDGRDGERDFIPEAVTSPAQRSSDRPAEASIQLTILRQSFESLRVKGADIVDNKAKPQTPTVNATGATSETKSTQAEQGTRASKNLTRPQVTKMLERVESTLKEAARSRDGRTISLHLEPVNLGKVKVDVSLRDGVLHARIAPENQQVVQALREHAHELQATLRKLGLDVDSVSVAVTADSFSGEMASGEQQMSGRSFHDERNNLPNRRAQVSENTLGNELADWSKAGTSTQGSVNGKVLDHWVA